ncbi:MAG: hypothetical protein HZB51_09910 [Chloroflexi bacterium]|nr:hypothetical protein [Chloroflexota bacterium]
MNSQYTFELAEKIANAILYEGYMRYPSQTAASPSQRRWTYGELYPQTYRGVQQGLEACHAQTECLVMGNAQTTLDIKLRFLHLVQRGIGKFIDDPSIEYVNVERLAVGDQVYCVEQEAIERECNYAHLSLTKMMQSFGFSFSSSRSTDTLQEPGGKTLGILTQRCEALAGTIKIMTKPLEDHLFKLSIQVRNRTPLSADPPTHADARLTSFVSTHLLLRVTGGEFISLNNPPAEYRSMTSLCENIRSCPVLIGEPGTHNLMLGSPVVLEDYPQIALGSTNDLLPATKNGDLLKVRMLPDEHVNQTLEQPNALPPEVFQRLNGAAHKLRPARGEP